MSRIPKSGALIAALVFLVSGAVSPLVSQESLRYDSQSFVGRGSRTFAVYQTIPLADGQFWELCIFALNDEQRTKKVKFEATAYLVDSDTPFELVEDLGSVKGSFRLQRDGTEAYGGECLELTASGAEYALICVEFNSATAGRVKAGTFNEYGVFASPVAGGFARATGAIRPENRFESGLPAPARPPTEDRQ